MNETLGKIHFLGSIVCMNLVFMPMFGMGLAGVSRRLWDGGAVYAHAQEVLHLNEYSTWGAFGLIFFQLFFIVNFFGSLFSKEKTGDNLWQATTLEWCAAPSPPLPHLNFARIPEVHRGPYEYSVPGHKTDFSPQTLKETEA